MCEFVTGREKLLAEYIFKANAVFAVVTSQEAGKSRNFTLKLQVHLAFVFDCKKNDNNEFIETF